MGKLFLVGTPIGNLGDMTYRAVETLRKVDFICAEDTRVTLKRLNHFGIKNELVSHYEHSDNKKIDYIVTRIAKGDSCAVVSDAGMQKLALTEGNNDNFTAKRLRRTFKKTHQKSILFFLNKKLVFKTNVSTGNAMLKYYALALPQMAAQVLLTQGVYALLSIPDSATGARTLIYAVVMTVLYFLSYMIQQRWVFAPQKNV